MADEENAFSIGKLPLIIGSAVAFGGFLMGLKMGSSVGFALGMALAGGVMGLAAGFVLSALVDLVKK